MSKKSSRNPEVTEFTYTEFFDNQLSLSSDLKEALMSQGLDWRFINANEFARKGNMHSSRWQPYVVKSGEVGSNQAGVGGMIKRGDLVLAVRPKQISVSHRKFLDDRNQRYSQTNYNKEQASMLKESARSYGVSGQTKIHEGYEDNE